MYPAYKVQIPLISTLSNLTPVIPLHLLCVCLTAMVAVTQIMFVKYQLTVPLNLDSTPPAEPWLFGLALACARSSQATRPL